MVKQKKSPGEHCFDIINILIMIGIAVITIYPIYYVAVCSISDGNQLIGARGLILRPLGLDWSAYKAVFSNPNIFSGYRITLTVVVIGTTLSVLTTAIGAFLITRKDFAAKRVLSYMMVFTMYFTGGMIPTYLVVNNFLHLGDKLAALILPTMISVYNLIIMKANFESIPDSIEEAAKIDGANDIVILFRIILPLSLSVIAVMVLFYGVSYWNSWFQAMMYMHDRSEYPLQLILREILISNDTSSMGTTSSAAGDQYMIGESIKYATIMVATLPILCLYPFIQKYFVKGVMVGAVKG
ncbi:MAG: carbohydrate ABC transporter permease [Clostridia bacterium]|nr:carbohydrate ABC transporter permease [Clostridia bacterium]